MIAVGRNIATAQKATLTRWPEGDASVKFEWADGAYLFIDYALISDAERSLQSAGFSAETVTQV